MFTSSYTLTVKAAGGLLEVRASGHYALNRSLHMIGAVREGADRYGVTQVLLETTAVAEQIPDVDRATLGEAAARSWRGLRVAILHRTPAPDNSATVVATNRGAIVRVFASVADAMEWLMGHYSDPRPL